jgi:formylmethanofuran dehydrogenase subunit E
MIGRVCGLMIGGFAVLVTIFQKKKAPMNRTPKYTAYFRCPKCNEQLINYSQSVLFIVDIFYEEIIKKCRICGETFIERKTIHTNKELLDGDKKQGKI